MTLPSRLAHDPPSPLSAGQTPIADVHQTRRALLILLAIALALRLIALAAIHLATGGSEINDDYLLYEAMVRRPLMLITGIGFRELGEGGIYAPLVPLQLWFPGHLISELTGPVLGRRLGMLAYDMTALTVSLNIALNIAGPPRTALQWIAAVMLAALPVSIGASVIWGQEDTAAALWSAASFAAFLWVGPLAAMIIAGAGLFTSKMFFVVLMAGIWLASPGKRTRLAIAGAGCAAAFAIFLLVRWRISGLVYPEYHYHAMSNSPSIWALYYLLIDPLKFDDTIRPYVKIVAAIAMFAFVAMAYRRPQMPVWAAVVATHAAFFASFIGIHPEHYQWFLPFLIVFAWHALQTRRRMAFALSIGITYLAYAYKIVYGLRGPVGNTAGGKQAIRDAFERYAGFDLYWIQVALVFVILGALIMLAREALRTKLKPVSV